MPSLADDITTGSSAEHPFRQRLAALRERLEGRPILRRLYRVAIAVLGGLIVVIGLILVPLPGPGWLIVFGGLGVLASEFHVARRATVVIRRLVLRAAEHWSQWRERRRDRRSRRRTARLRATVVARMAAGRIVVVPERGV
ncbi:MAG: TIGR02611 family protein [Mycetocola sp.]